MPYRKTLYIPDDKKAMFDEFEKIADGLNMSLSGLFIDTLPRAMESINSLENQGQEITILIKKKSVDFAPPTLKQIKFIGEKIAETEVLFSSNQTVFCLKPELPVENWTGLRHQYTFYKTRKNTILFYVRLLHVQYNTYDPEEGRIYDLNDYNVLEEELIYKTYDGSELNTIIWEIDDIPHYCLDKLIPAFAETEVLDI